MLPLEGESGPLDFFGTGYSPNDQLQLKWILDRGRRSLMPVQRDRMETLCGNLCNNVRIGNNDGILLGTF